MTSQINIEMEEKISQIPSTQAIATEKVYI